MLHLVKTQSPTQFFFSSLMRVEARSVICRLRKGARLSPDDARQILTDIESELTRMTEQRLSRDVQTLAAILVERHSIRSLDALQLASAIVARDRNGPLLFVGADRRLNDIAQLEGFAVWNPED